MATIIGALTAAAALASAGTGVYAAMNSGNTRAASRAEGLGDLGATNALANQDYMKLLNTLGLTRSTAGTTDAEGNETYYDPATNTWRSKLGDKPAQVQAAAENASISRNTTDLRNAQYVNELAMRRASAAQPGADQARRELENFRPTSADNLTSLLMRNIVDTTNRTREPARQDLLSSTARTGSAAGPTLTMMDRDNADNVRKSALEATLAGRQGVGQINAANLAPLIQKYSTLMGGTQPQLQYSQIDSQDPSKVLNALAGERAKTAGLVPASGMQGLGYAQYGVGSALEKAMGSGAPDTSGSKALAVGGIMSNLLKDPAIVGSDANKNTKGLVGLFGSGSKSNTNAITSYPSMNDKFGGVYVGY